MNINTTSLKNAIHSLKLALDEFDKTNSPFIKDTCIKRFEYTYELSHKMLKRQLKNMSAHPEELEKIDFQNLIRTGNEKELLLSDWEKWKKYRTARGTTSHAYDEEKAIEVFNIIPAFYEEASYLLASIEKHNEQAN